MVNFIVSARSEISQIRPKDLKRDKLPRAGKELDAIVEATESATNQIMEAAEKIMDARVTEANVVNDACMDIFEACSFQDITGQRISKVVSTLEYIETYLDKLTAAWGHDENSEAAVEAADPEDEEAALLNGPALAGEGVDQDYVDDMFADSSANDESSSAAPADENSPGKQKKQSDIEGQQSVDQDDIDALFN
ncbi:protein phosphatase CheZ [Sneathiella glossodoripedis]|uniref:protein phosphatase CheZ n=1 Tax=Sneathiella glossodoripedis TaxID=418853 RepID=UPI000470D13B|nr:protein phosphatase CheZ [Sneathiella glossodoripedis]